MVERAKTDGLDLPGVAHARGLISIMMGENGGGGGGGGGGGESKRLKSTAVMLRF